MSTENATAENLDDTKTPSGKVEKAEHEPTAEGKADAISEKPDSAASEKADGDKSAADQASGTKKKKKPIEYVIKTTNLTKRFGAKTAVNGVSLKIRAGHIFGLIGPNGAGKTTTFSMLAGFLRPTEGTIDVLGFEPTNVNALRARLGVLPQDALLPATDKVGEFLTHMARLQNIPREKAEEAARKVLGEVSGADWWNLKCGGLSHGMQKRIAIAQAFLGEPEVVFLDEPTAGVDPRVAYELREVIKARKGRCTMVISSHNLQELEEICDAAAILDHGRLVTSGSITELTASTGEFRIRIKLPTADKNGAAYRGEARVSIPFGELRAIALVTGVNFEEDKSELVVSFEKGKVDTETVIGQALWCLLNARVGISGVSKGKSLEQRVMELTD
jgi:ABC-2 type transport system ATP-binding protein